MYTHTHTHTQTHTHTHITQNTHTCTRTHTHTAQSRTQHPRKWRSHNFFLDAAQFCTHIWHSPLVYVYTHTHTHTHTHTYAPLPHTGAASTFGYGDSAKYFPQGRKHRVEILKSQLAIKLTIWNDSSAHFSRICKNLSKVISLLLWL